MHLARAAEEGRVFVTNDRGMKARAESRLKEGKPFRGMITWPRAHYLRMSPGDFVEAFEELASQDDPFAGYPIIHLKPKS